jgi:hypothetical protein
MTCRLGDMEYAPDKRQREIGGVASKDQKWFIKELCMCWIEFDVEWETIRI